MDAGHIASGNLSRAAVFSKSQARHAGSVPAAQPRAPEPVVLHIYHLSGKKRIKFANRVLRMFGTGAYHAAVEVARACGVGRGLGSQSRGCSSLRHSPAPGGVALINIRMRFVFAQLLECIVFARLRLLVNGWPTSRRMSLAPTGAGGC